MEKLPQTGGAGATLDRAALLTLATKLGYVDFFHALSAALCARFEADYVGVAVADDGEITHFRMLHELSPNGDTSLPPASAGLFARACDAPSELLITAESVDSARLPFPGGSMVLAPLGATGRRFGALAIASRRSDAFAGSIDDVTAAADIAALVAGALVAADEAKDRAEELALLIDATRALSTERDLPKLFAQFHELVGGVMDARTFLIALGAPDGESIEYPYAVSDGHPITIPTVARGTSLCGQVFSRGKPLLLRTFEGFAAYNAPSAGDGDDVQSAIYVPMRISDRTIGVISVQSEHEAAFTERDLELLVAIAEQGAIAVENSQYLQRAEQRARELKLLAEVSRALSAQLSLRTLCQTVCREVRRVMDAPIFLVSLLAPDRETMHIEFVAENDAEIELADYPLTGTLAERVIASNEALVVQNRDELAVGPRHILKTGGQTVRSLAMAPLRLADRCIGILTAQSYEEGAYKDSDVRLLSAIAEQMALAVQNAQMFREAQNRADRDPLTNLYHHRYLKTRLDDEIERARAEETEIAVLMLDLDDFKLVNDMHGHPAGDEALRVLTGVLHSTCRSADIVGRYGGDEFLVILPATSADRAHVIGARIRDAVSSRKLRLPSGAAVPLRASIGIATYPADGATAGELVQRADAALYQSKRHGRPVAALQRIGTTELRLEGNFSPVAELLAALLTRDPDSRIRIENANRLAKDVAAAFALSVSDAEALMLASVLRDVGKIAIPEHLLRKPGPLTPAEYELVKRHATIGAMLLENIPSFEQVAIAIRHHHERFDGGGYPDGLAGRDIPLLARLLALLDAFMAMTCDRPHMPRMSATEAAGTVRKAAGAQFDPEFVERFIGVATVGRR